VAFAQKVIPNPPANYTIDPYNNETAESLNIIDATDSNKVIVCTIKYLDP
jgi:hypothetical protein